MAKVTNTFSENVPYEQDRPNFYVDNDKNWPIGVPAFTGNPMIDAMGYQTTFVHNQLMGAIGGHYEIKARTKLIKPEGDNVGDLGSIPNLLPGNILVDGTPVGEYIFEQTVLEDNLAEAELNSPGFSSLKQDED